MICINKKLLAVVAASAILFALVFAVAEEEKKEEKEEVHPHVLYLTDENYDTEIAKYDTVLAAGVASWCGHCKALKPAFAAAAKTLAEAGSEFDRVKFALVDAEKNTRLAGMLKVQGYPTMRWVVLGTVLDGDYEGGRKEDELIAAIKAKASMPVLKEITDSKTWRDTINVKKMEGGPRVCGVFSSKNSIDFKYFKAVALSFAGSGLEVFWSATPSVHEAVGFFGSGSAITVYRPGAKPPKKMFKGTVFKQDLSDFIVANALPRDSVPTYTPTNAKLFEKTGDSVVRIVHDGSNPAVMSTLNAAVKSTDEALKEVRFATSKLSDFEKEAEALCGKDAVAAKICVVGKYGSKVKGKAGTEHGMSEGAFSAAAFDKWLNQFVKKELKQKVKSQPIPDAKPEAGKVFKLVGNTFEQYVLEEKSKAVFIKFFAPWCGHCKAMAADYEKLASELADKFDKVMIAEFDLDSNDLPSVARNAFSVGGFPTLYLQTASGKVTKHEGGRKLDDLKKFVEESI